MGTPPGGTITPKTAPTNCYDTPANVQFKKTTTCSATYHICPGKCGTIFSVASISVTASQGSIYANAIEDTGYLLTTEAEVTASLIYNNEEGNVIGAGENFNTTLLTANEHFNDTSRGDQIILIEVGNSYGRSTGSTKFIISPNNAYIQARPWAISFESG